MRVIWSAERFALETCWTKSEERDLVDRALLELPRFSACLSAA
jgi:hypothetical protein